MFKSRTRLPSVAFLPLALMFLAGANAQSPYRAKIQRTEFGIPHITAANYAGLGYGLGYAYAQDNFCMLADYLLTISGDRSRYFGPDGTARTPYFTSITHKNLDSDLFFKSQLDTAALRRAARKLPGAVTDFLHGYAAGYNRYLRETGAQALPAACRGAPWVRPMTFDDELRMAQEKLIEEDFESPAIFPALLDAAPPGTQQAAARTRDTTAEGAPALQPLGGAAEQLGSNGWAFGRAVTRNGSGLVLGNPHMPWSGADRFYEAQLVIPGRVDVMGAYYPGSVGLGIGFNKDVAWTATVDTDRHFTIYRLTLDPSDPTTYIVDGKKHQMLRKTVRVQVSHGNKLVTVARTYYSSIYGPIMVNDRLGAFWTRRYAFAIRDGNEGRIAEMLATPLALDRATNVHALRAALFGSRMPFFNVIAADRNGEVLYADITPTPDITPAMLAHCFPAPALRRLAQTRQLYVLDGSKSACAWEPIPPHSLPAIIRSDYVANSNDSFWLVNPASPITSQPPIVGPTDSQLRWRTRAGLIEIEKRLAGQDGLPGHRVDPDAVQHMLFRNWDLAASLFLPDILSDCGSGGTVTDADGKAVAIGKACAILAKWNGRADVDSRGAFLFAEIWSRILHIPDVYKVPFDPRDPIHTPRGLSAAPDTVQSIREAIGDAVTAMSRAGFPLDGTLGQVQFRVSGHDRIPLPGGSGDDGILNVIKCAPTPGMGCEPVMGSSYIQVVTFDKSGPVARGVLTYSESSDPASPHYADQTRAFSDGQLPALPFSEKAIAADASLSSLIIDEPAAHTDSRLAR